MTVDGAAMQRVMADMATVMSGFKRIFNETVIALDNLGSRLSWWGGDEPTWEWPVEGRPRPVILERHPRLHDGSLGAGSLDQYVMPGWQPAVRGHEVVVERWHADPRVPRWSP